MTHVLSSEPDTDTRVRFAAGIEITLSQHDDATVVTLSGDVDCSSASHLREVLDALVIAGVQKVVIDAGDVSFIDSTGVGVLVTAQRHLQREHGGALTVRSPSRVVYRVLELAGLTASFAVPPASRFPVRS